jgi:hypothetical protein
MMNATDCFLRHLTPIARSAQPLRRSIDINVSFRNRLAIDLLEFARVSPNQVVDRLMRWSGRRAA